MKGIVFADPLNGSGKFHFCFKLSQGFKQFLKCSLRSRLPRSQSPCVSWGHCQYPPPTSIFWGWIVSCLFMLSHESLKLKFVCSSASHSYMFSFIVHFCYRILSQGCWTVWGCKYAERKVSNSVSLWSHLSRSWVLWCLPRYEQQVKLSLCLRLSQNYKEKVFNVALWRSSVLPQSRANFSVVLVT